GGARCRRRDRRLLADFGGARIARRARAQVVHGRRRRRWRWWWRRGPRRRDEHLDARVPADPHLPVEVVAELVGVVGELRVAALRRHVPAAAEAEEESLLRLHRD